MALLIGTSILPPRSLRTTMTQIKYSQSTDPAKTPPTRQTPAVFMGRNLEESFAELGLPRNTFVTSDMTVLMAYAMALGEQTTSHKRSSHLNNDFRSHSKPFQADQ